MASTTSRCASKPSFRLPRPGRPSDSLLPCGNSRTPGRNRSVAPRVPRSPYLTNHAPFLSTRAERGHRTRRHVEGRVPVPAPRPPRLRIFRRGVQSARSTHRARRRAEASPGRAPDRRRRASGPPRGRRPEPPGPSEHHQDLQHLPHPRHVGREGPGSRHVRAGARVRRHVHGLRVRHGRGPVRPARGHDPGRGAIADAPAGERGEVPPRRRGVAQGHQVGKHPLRAEQARRPRREGLRLWPRAGRRGRWERSRSKERSVVDGGRSRAHGGWRRRRRRGVVFRPLEKAAQPGLAQSELVRLVREQREEFRGARDAHRRRRHPVLPRARGDHVRGQVHRSDGRVGPGVHIRGVAPATERRRAHPTPHDLAPVSLRRRPDAAPSGF